MLFVCTFYIQKQWAIFTKFSMEVIPLEATTDSRITVSKICKNNVSGTDTYGVGLAKCKLLTPWCRVLLEKLTGLQLVKKFIQRLQSKILRYITNAPWYVSNFTLHTDLRIPFVTTEINRLSLLYHQRLVGRHNELISAMSNPPTYARRLKRQWTSDLFPPKRQIKHNTLP